MKPVFILGVGCQKGGTSWLYQYLAAHPDVRMSSSKEMHIFDALFMPELFGNFYRQNLLLVQQEIAEILPKQTIFPAEDIKLRNQLDRLNAYYDVQEYRRYFLRLAGSYGDAQQPVRAVGEITPAYAALNADHFLQIKELLREDFNIKIIFLMRDPVERIWSQRRMTDRQEASNRADKNIAPSVLTPEYVKDKEVVVRTNYKMTIKNLEQVFDPDDIYYGFYETLFSDEEIGRLCAFLGIHNIEANFDKRWNVSPNGDQRPDNEVVREARSYYDDTYRFCAERFSADFIKRIWKYYSAT